VVGLRRARIGAEGHLADDRRYIFELDMASGNVVPRDVYYGMGKTDDEGEFRFGHMREPFSLESATSANSLGFMERSPINDLDPSRNWGIGYFRSSEDLDATVGAGVFKSGSGPSDLQGGDGNDTAATAKWTALPLYEDEGGRLMHIGAAVSSRFPTNGLVVINQTPQSPLLNLGDSSASPFVPTFKVPANFQQLFNLQWAAVNGPLWMEAEWYGSLINQLHAGNVFLQGAHLDAGLFLAGAARRSYDRRQGFFGAVHVDRPWLRRFAAKREPRARGYGAWELTSRVSYLDYQDPDIPAGTAPYVGVLLPQMTVGANWYLADRFRILFNYTLVAPQEAASGTSLAGVFGTRVGVFW
jgi:phosphate-selective porin OprO/OprP